MRHVGVRVGDIPDPLLADIDANLQTYFLPIVGRDDERTEEPLRLIGSGTFVSIGSTYHILTAAHVWDATRKFPTVALLLGSPRSCLSIPREHLVTRRLRGDGPEEDGPDLALLALPAAFVPNVRACKSALDLAQQRNKFLADPVRPDSGLWAIIGLEGVSSTVQPRPDARAVDVSYTVHSFVGGIDAFHERDGYDYLDAGVDTKLSAVPSSFGGVSGGALWQIGLVMNKERQLSWKGQKSFQGLAFWQSPILDGRRTIRCHGRKSLFEKAWQEWELPADH